MTAITVEQLTTGNTSGDGAFDTLMKSVRSHLDREYANGRINGTDFATVYSNTITTVLQQSIAFLLTNQKAEKELELLEAQVALEQAKAQTEALQQAILTAQKANLEQENLILQAQESEVVAKTAMINAETDLIPAKKAEIEAKTAIHEQTLLNEQAQNAVIVQQECKLKAEFDVLVEQKLKVNADTALIGQRIVTERAQVSPDGVDDNSIIGKQKLLHQAQITGFAQDARQKAANIWKDVWIAQRTTDTGISPTPENKLDDITMGAVMQKVIDGV